ncbi:hypothetical protein K435DRAFT_684169, partial [Dendrothele bispora CBS 962.96]
NKLSLQLVEALQMLKFALQKGDALNFTAQFKEEEEMADLENILSDQLQVPEDLNTFVKELFN